MQEKTHFKLHKVKKHWVSFAATTAVASLLFLSASQAGADQLGAEPQETSASQVEQVPQTQTSETQVNPSPTSQPDTSSDYSQAGQVENLTPEQSDTKELDQEAASQSEQVANTALSAASVNSTETQSQLPTNSFYEKDGHWYYADANQQNVTGWQTINGQRLYFNEDGSQVKGGGITYQGASYYFDQDTGDMWTNRFANHPNYKQDGSKTDNWFYYGQDGKRVTGWQSIDGKQMYFITEEDQKAQAGDSSALPVGSQIKGRLQTIAGKNYYFDPDNGGLWTNRDLTIGQKTYHLDQNGVAQEKTGQEASQPADTQVGGHYEQANFYLGAYGAYYQAWVYLDKDGKRVTGLQTIEGKQVYFFDNGEQARDRLVWIDDNTYFFDDKGQMVTNQTVDYNRTTAMNYDGYQPEYKGWLHLGADGKADAGYRTVVGNEYIYRRTADGKGEWVKK